jgi:hypothetical protein
MTGRFVPQPPSTNTLKWLASGSKLLDALSPDLNSKINKFAATIPCYPYIPLPTFTATYNEFTPAERPANMSEFLTRKKPRINSFVENSNEKDIYKRIKQEIPNFDYGAIDNFEGRIPKYALNITNKSLPNIPSFTDYTNIEYTLSNYTQIKNIPSITLKSDEKFKMSGFGDFLLGLSYNDYVSEISTTTKETADCSVYHWAKEYLKYMYGGDLTFQALDNLKHRSIYLGFYNIEISKIYFTTVRENGTKINSAKPLDCKTVARVIESKVFYGVPTFDLSENADKTSLTDFEIKWNIIGAEDLIKTYQVLTDEPASNYPKWNDLERV